MTGPQSNGGIMIYYVKQFIEPHLSYNSFHLGVIKRFHNRLFICYQKMLNKVDFVSLLVIRSL